MVKRIISAIVLIALFAPAFYISGAYLYIVEAIIMITSGYEIMKLVGKDYNLLEKTIFYIFYLGCFVASIFSVKYAILTILLFIIVFFSISITNEKVTITDFSLIVLLTIILISFDIGAVELSRNKQLMLIVMLGTFLTDACALFIGMAIGKHKLNERISPNKTIEGAVGGFIVTAVVNIIVAILSKQTSWQIITICVLTPIVGQFGDLAYSEIKRHYGIKDFGKLIPGHGGTLDRIDSFTFNVMISLIILGII